MLSGVHSGRAQAQTTFSLEYTAPTICPDKAQFVQAIVVRAPEAREVAPESASFHFVAHLAASGADGTLARGYVSVARQGHSQSVRDIAEAPCSEVVESMAVILSLILAGRESTLNTAGAPAALDPAAAPPVPPPQAANGATPTPAPSSALQPPAEAASTIQPAAPREVDPNASPTALEEPGSDSSARVRFGVYLAGVAETGVAPSIALGGQGGLDLWWTRSSVWSPSARLTGRYVRSGVEDISAGSARFRLAALRAELCPLRWPERSSTSARVCALFDAGRLEAQPQRAQEGETQNQSMPWFGGGGSLRLESALADFISVEAAADLVVLGRADHFTFDPGEQSLHQVPRVSVMFSLGVALRLP